MGITLKINEMTEVDRGTLIFREDDAADRVCIILKGRVELSNRGCKVVLGNGCFLGVQDIYMGRYLGNYKALDDVVLYTYEAPGVDITEKLLAGNKDYRGLLVYSMARVIAQEDKIRKLLAARAEQSFAWMKDCYRRYLEIANKAHVSGITRHPQIEEMAAYEEADMIDQKKLDFFLETAVVPTDILKKYFACGSALALFPVEQANGVITELMIECMELADYLVELTSCIAGAKGNCLFDSLIRLALTLDSGDGAEKEYAEISSLIDEAMDCLNQLEDVIEKNTGRDGFVDRSRLELLYMALLNGADAKKNKSADSGVVRMHTLEDDLAELQDSTRQILEFSAVDETVATQFVSVIQAFENLRDRTSTDDMVRQLRRGIASLFYQIYEAAFLKACETEQMPLAAELFLKFGYISEKLLNKEEIVFFLNQRKPEQESDRILSGEAVPDAVSEEMRGRSENGPAKNEETCHFYTIYEWLKAVYEGKKAPSKNEFDLEYSDYVRSLRKQNQVTEEQQQEMLTNPRALLHYEIQNFFAVNNRAVCTQPTTFVPILYHEQMPPVFETRYQTEEAVTERINAIRRIDFGAFFREILYTNKALGIDKIYVAKEILPDIVFMPTVGGRISMWQECASKRRELPGRVAIPMIFSEDIDNSLIRMFGRFRWELCRFLQGGSWNNIRYHSLTSEYYDFLQFFRKNRELSEERKEKVKHQITKAKNNSREVFVQDYEVWIRFESTGAMRLSKPVREMLATWCPFDAPVRKKLAGQPIFDEAMARGNRERQQKIHEYEQRIRLYEKEIGKENIPQEIYDTLEYYKNH